MIREMYSLMNVEGLSIRRGHIKEEDYKFFHHLKPRILFIPIALEEHVRRGIVESGVSL